MEDGVRHKASARFRLAGGLFPEGPELEGPADVSREHCRIRRDSKTGTFFIKDLSQFGTTVNGAAIPNSVERIEGGDKVDRNREAPLPSPAKITLSDVLTLEFEAEPSQ